MSARNRFVRIWRHPSATTRNTPANSRAPFPPSKARNGPDMGFRRVHTRRLDVSKSIPRTMKPPPKIQIAQERLALDGFHAGLRGQRLEMRFADQRGMEAGVVENSRKGRHILEKFGPERPRPMLRRHHPGEQARSRGRAGGICTIGPVESRSLPGQSIQGRCLDFRIHRTQSRPVLLVRGDEENICRHFLELGILRHPSGDLHPTDGCAGRIGSKNVLYRIAPATMCKSRKS